MSTIMPTRDNECKVDYISEVPNQLLSSYFTGFVDVIQVGILTVSDRAATNSYIHGDLSGPAVERSIQAVFDTLNECNQQRLSYNIHHKDIVPDDEDQIVDKLIAWSDYDHPSQSSSTLSIKCDIILTTGGTGFSPRDHTPEATAKVLDMECRGLMTWVYSECTKKQPLACLSRGIAGVRNKTLIANLPGNPQGVHDVIVKLLPLLLHALKDIRDYAS
jgi:gephyrin